MMSRLSQHNHSTSVPESRPAAPGEEVRLSAGTLNAVYVDGDVRYLRVGGHEVIRRISAPVRDSAWGTVPPIISNVCVSEGVNGFDIEYDAENIEGEIRFAWRAVISGRSSVLADGQVQTSVTFSMRGEARSTFRTCRAGICVLHPIRECRGRACVIESPEGERHEGRFPDLISPDQPFTNIRSMSYAIASGLHATVVFDGEVFETEDQRNWADTSYKTYCRPLSRPFPYMIQKGETVRQSVNITVTSEAPHPVRSEPGLVLSEGALCRVGRVGVALGDLSSPLPEVQRDRLRSMGLSHLRVDCRPASHGWEQSLAAAVTDAERIAIPIELGLHLTPRDTEGEKELTKCAGVLRRMKARIGRCVVYETGQHMAAPHRVVQAKRSLSSIDGLAQIGGGTAGNFAELNRNRPPAGTTDVLAWPVNPQRHAGDSLTLIENLASQRDGVVTARAFAPSAVLAVGPVTFHRIPDPAAAGKGGSEQEAVRADPRQRELLGAAWTLGSLKYLLEAGADAVTYFEAAGALGVQDGEGVFPLYHVLADVCEFVGGDVLTCTDPDPLSFVGLMLHRDRRLRLLVGNLRPASQSVAVTGLGGYQLVGGYRLGADELHEAMSEPQAFRVRTSRWNGAVPETLDLPPYAIARLDLARKE